MSWQRVNAGPDPARSSACDQVYSIEAGRLHDAAMSRAAT